MSLYDYQKSREISVESHPFNAIIMAAMRQADSENIAKLTAAFPDIFHELQTRYHAPGGLLDSELQEMQERDKAAELLDANEQAVSP